jgi:outer membrane protein assembly factor BamB
MSMSQQKTFPISAALISLAIGVGGTAARAEDWPQFRGPNRNAISAERGVWEKMQGDGPKLDWMCEGLGEGYASVSVVGDRAYSTGNQDGGQAVVAIDTTSGTRLWVTPLTSDVPQHGYEGSRCTPTVDGDRLYAVASNGQIVCLEAESGKILWQRPFSDWNGRMMSGWGFSESPLVDGDWVLCTPGGDKAMIVALDKKTGKEVWRSEVPGAGDEKDRQGRGLQNGAAYSSIIVSNGGGVKQYVQLVGQGVIGIRAKDGKFLWRYSGVANAVANIPTPIADGNYIFCSTAYGVGTALLELKKSGRDSVTMKEVYFKDSKAIQNKQGGSVLVDGYIYCGHGDGQGMPICINMLTGEKAWGPIRGAGQGESSVIYADGHVLYRFQDGTIALIEANPNEYKLKYSFKPEYQERESWAYPVIANGKLYLREQNKLMCYEL